MADEETRETTAKDKWQPAEPPIGGQARRQTCPKCHQRECRGHKRRRDGATVWWSTADDMFTATKPERT